MINSVSDQDEIYIKILEEVISKISCLLNQQLNLIIHHPRFQKLEASWRGVKLLVAFTKQNKVIKLKMLNLTAKELSKDVGNATDPEQTYLFQKVYTQEFDVPGGEPYGILLGDYAFNHKPSNEIKDSISLLKVLGQICTAAFCPFVSAISASHFGVNRFSEYPQHANLQKLFKQTEYDRWKSLHEDEATRFISLMLPKFMIRKPYDTNYEKKSRFFSETVKTTENILWANPAYLMGCSVIECFIDTGWFGKLRGYHLNLDGHQTPFSGRLHQLTDPNLSMPKCITELQITDDFERNISNEGYTCLKDNPWQQRMNIFNCPSLYIGQSYNSNIATANLKISGMMHYVLCVSRFAHYVKVIARDKIGSFVNAKSCEASLNKWLHQYTTSSSTSSPNMLARFPLSAASVQIQPKPGVSGEFNGIIHIKPHYQLDSMSSHLKLVTDIKLS